MLFATYIRTLQAISMEPTTGMNMFTVLLLVVLLILILMNLKSFKKLPPGPRPWPIIGNLHQIGKNPHITITRFAQLHGPLISLKLGSQLFIFGSSPAAAKEILKTHGRLISGRYLPKVNIPHLNQFSLIGAADCNDVWKSLRCLCQTELFSTKSLESQSSLRENKVASMVEFLSTKHGQEVKIAEIVFATMFNVLGNVFFSKDFLDLEDNQGFASGLKDTIRKITGMVTTPNISDFYPLFDVFDPQGMRKKLKELSNDIYGVWDVIIKERREINDGTFEEQKDLLDVMLANGFSDDQINVLASDLFVAGTDTTTTTIEWALSELLKNKDVMNKVLEELKRETNGPNSINETQISRLSYLSACVKETLRLHPPAPFLLRRTIDKCEVMNYMIPKNCNVFVNVWAIGRDPSVWEDPSSFKPERFLNSNVDFRGHHFELLPFGSGRRICPGITMGTKLVELIIASLICHFEWSLPNNCDTSRIDMKENFGLALQREQPLLLIPKLK